MISTWKTYIYTNHRLPHKLAFLCRLAGVTVGIWFLLMTTSTSTTVVSSSHRSRACNIIVTVNELPRLSLVWTSSRCEVSEICLQCQGTKGLIYQTYGLSDKDWTLNFTTTHDIGLLIMRMRDSPTHFRILTRNCKANPQP
ncbi:hypothetical protein CY34DRAFT_587718 [Suillus luteus UH-Slu-Lm8-n1]|uniref:Unplaced genomic scaffold CY34scaffold_503, whole genome shotgun sequence n=1 Tax=Suillus luteus UH-Slu-Lm8-n1 TaxID=930992 RepID=A0A0D0AMB7_9AGAM|nr:hypothetical protein CY34DRAFT_587718 [Suillus luteus UH-Slu-Lm8-n1]